jgi:hypothetical protein
VYTSFVFEYKSSKKRLKGTQSCLSDLDIGKAKRGRLARLSHCWAESDRNRVRFATPTSRDVFSQIHGQDEPFPLIRPANPISVMQILAPEGAVVRANNVLVLDNSVLIV